MKKMKSMMFYQIHKVLMSNEENEEYDVLSDDRDETLERVKGVMRFLDALSIEWNKARSLKIREACNDRLFEILPVELVNLLDEVSDVLTCEEEDCLELCHSDWDFCEKHGKKVE